MADVTDLKARKREIEQEAYGYYEQFSGTVLARRADGSFRAQGHNDALDAFRHAYTSGRVTQIALGQQWIARRFGDDAEIGPAHPNDPYEHRMDLWNNEIGRRLGDATGNADALASNAFRALRNGELITRLDDVRLRRIFAGDPRLALPANHPQRELVTADDVGIMNRDIARLQDQAPERFPAHHEDAGYFNAIRNQLPASISDTKVAEVLLAAKMSGIQRADQVGDVLLRDDRIFVIGTTPGFRTVVDATSPAPEMRDTVYQTSQHNAIDRYEQDNTAQRQAAGRSY